MRSPLELWQVAGALCNVFVMKGLWPQAVVGSAKKGQRALQLALPRSLFQSTLQTQMVRDYGTGYEGDDVGVE